MVINCVEISVKNLEESIKFYQEAFECEMIFESPTGLGRMARLKSGDLFISLLESPKLPIGIIGIVCDAPNGDIDAAFKELQGKGARAVMEPQLIGKGKLAKLFDPNDISVSIIAQNADPTDTGARVTHLPNKIK